ncbi:hypothetical protein MNBD_GAMMA12-1066 [hydrothermal vent metagenome]|uniref:Uncharacterized protein n=1 Tax=hydrothermal vent metagenome TaxID=652676 RepID=A0A3B0Z1X8_9ZZZZ
MQDYDKPILIAKKITFTIMAVLFAVPLLLLLFYLLVSPAVLSIDWTIKSNDFYEKYFVENSLPENTRQIARWRKANCELFFGVLLESDLELHKIQKYYNNIKLKNFKPRIVLLNLRHYYWFGKKIANSDSLADDIGFRPLMNRLNTIGRKQGKHYFILYIADLLDGEWYSVCD